MGGARKSKSSMRKDQETPLAADAAGEDDEDDELRDDAAPAAGGSMGWLSKAASYTALLVAWVATCGSLFMSEALGWVPCLLCWYQRILMYPLALITAVGLLRRDNRAHAYVLALSVPGMAMSFYHYLYQKTDLFRGMVPCTVGVPCSSDYLNWLGGVVTIPFLALVAFALISVSVLVSRLGGQPVPDPEPAEGAPSGGAARRAARALPVFAIIGGVVLAFLLAAQAARASASGPASTVPAASAASAASGVSDAAVDAAALQKGQALYEQACAACHGLNGEGAPAGRSLTDSAIVRNGSDAELIAMVRIGRTAQDAHNTTGRPMPAGGGRSDIGEADLAAIVAYLRALAAQAP
jgi:disulfide bond formation protein DsbB